MRLSGLTVMSFALMLVSALARKNPENPSTLKNAVRRSLSSSQALAYLAAILANVSIEMGYFNFSRCSVMGSFTGLYNISD